MSVRCDRPLVVSLRVRHGPRQVTSFVAAAAYLHQIGDVKLLPGMAKQAGEVVKALPIPEAQERPLVGDRPVLSLLANEIRDGRSHGRGHQTGFLQAARRGQQLSHQGARADVWMMCHRGLPFE